MNSWIDISETALVANYRALQAEAGLDMAVLAVIKANAYGHGAERCGVALARAGAPWLGVTCASEGARVRQALHAAGLGADAQPEMLVMCGSLPEDTPLLTANRLTPTVWTPEQAQALPPGTRVHVEVDTGMGRQGVALECDFSAVPAAPEDSPSSSRKTAHQGDFAELLRALNENGLVLDGVYTHFCSAEEWPANRTRAQQQRFELSLGHLFDGMILPGWVHVGNTSTLDNPSHDAPWLTRLAARWGMRAMMRSGLGLYGYALPIEFSAGNRSAMPRLRPTLQPVMTWKAHVLAVRTLAPGECVGYNATFHARKPMRVALLPVGYADGLRRELSSTNDRPGGWVMLHGARAPILGRISMNLTVVDVTGIDGVRMGDQATVLGAGVTADDHARLAGTIAYEILCGVHPCG